MAPGVSWIRAATPSLPWAEIASFHFGDLSTPGVHSTLSDLATEFMWLEKAQLVPELSARVTTVMSRSGILTPGLVLAMASSLQLVISRRKMRTYASRERRIGSVRPGTL